MLHQRRRTRVVGGEAARERRRRRRRAERETTCQSPPLRPEGSRAAQQALGGGRAQRLRQVEGAGSRAGCPPWAPARAGEGEALAAHRQGESLLPAAPRIVAAGPPRRRSRRRRVPERRPSESPPAHPSVGVARGRAPRRASHALQRRQPQPLGAQPPPGAAQAEGGWAVRGRVAGHGGSPAASAALPRLPCRRRAARRAALGAARAARRGARRGALQTRRCEQARPSRWCCFLAAELATGQTLLGGGAAV